MSKVVYCRRCGTRCHNVEVGASSVRMRRGVKVGRVELRSMTPSCIVLEAKIDPRVTSEELCSDNKGVRFKGRLSGISW